MTYGNNKNMEVKCIRPFTFMFQFEREAGLTRSKSFSVRKDEVEKISDRSSLISLGCALGGNIF